METTNDISVCERLVMKVIWDSTEDLALQEVMNRVNQENGKSWKPQTVSTFLARLVRKGFLTVYRKGRYSYYVPAVSKQDYWRATMTENAQFFTQGDMGVLACQLYDDMLDDEQMKKLKDKLKDME
ncbi:MAG: BlaI/MecI/CopY family transcriptional regulator [Roseburia sp.]|nr:BlaI/MecI/CopY family transcriptional regulator [Roseburia sp.]